VAQVLRDEDLQPLSERREPPPSADGHDGSRRTVKGGHEHDQTRRQARHEFLERVHARSEGADGHRSYVGARGTQRIQHTG
jgi:hypothetical protein